MIAAMIVGPRADLAGGLKARIQQSGQVVALKEFDRRPTREELDGAMRAHDPKAVFIDVSEGAPAIRGAAEMQARWPSAIFVAYDYMADPSTLVDLMRAGIREFICSPFTEKDYFVCIDRILALAGSPAALAAAVAERSTKSVFAFLPAKPGVGASTAAINTALALARNEERRILLVDFDLGCGVTRFHLKAEHPYSIMDALERAHSLEDGVWEELVSKCGRLHLLPTAPPGPSLQANPVSIAPLFDFMRRRYDTILLDCSGYLDAFAMEYLAQCRRILLVAEPDMTAVHMGREKLAILRGAELEDRVELALNRWKRGAPLSLADIEGVLGIAADHLLPDDPKSAYQSVLRGTGADPGGALGKAATALADSLEGVEPLAEAIAPRKRMVEYFSLSPSLRHGR